MLGIVFIAFVLLLAYCFFCVDESKGDFKDSFKVSLIKLLERVFLLLTTGYSFNINSIYE
jgi:hypothetical protein